VSSSNARRNRIITTGMLAGLLLSVSGDFLLFIAQRCLNWLVLHGFGGGINASWTGGSGPISIMTSPVTLLLMALAGAVAGLSVGIFAAALLPEQPSATPETAGLPGVPAASGSAERAPS
jgi:hypothetical protein